MWLSKRGIRAIPIIYVCMETRGGVLNVAAARLQDYYLRINVNLPYVLKLNQWNMEYAVSEPATDVTAYTSDKPRSTKRT